MSKKVKKTREQIKKNKEKRKEYNLKNREKILEGQKKYWDANKEKILERQKKYREDNKDKINALKNKISNTQKMKNKLVKNLKDIISINYKERGLSKPSNIEEVLGISFKDFYSYIETYFNSWVKWCDYGFKKDKTNYTYWILSLKDKTVDFSELNNYKNFCIKIMIKKEK